MKIQIYKKIALQWMRWKSKPIEVKLVQEINEWTT